MQSSNIRDIPQRLLPEPSGPVGMSMNSLHQCRADKLLDGFGERVGNSWYYSRAEVLAIALASALARAGLGLKSAFEAIANPTPGIIAALAGHGDTLTFRPRRNAEGVGALSCSIKVVVDAAEIVRSASARLDVALEAERRRPRRRLDFEPAPVSA